MEGKTVPLNLLSALPMSNIKKGGGAKILYFCLYILRKNKLERKMKAVADSHTLSIRPTLLQSSNDFAILQLQKQLNEVIQLKSRKSGFYLS